jgi:PAS domain S-box-containing protein
MSRRTEEFWRILYIEDDEEDFILVRHMLAQSQWRQIDLVWAETYEEGCQKLADEHYDAVLVDYDLGSNTGIDLISLFSCGCSAPLILYTGRGSREVDLEAMSAGATLYVTKNEVNPLLLERSIRYAIEIKQKENELRISRETLKQELAERKLTEEALRESEAKLAVQLADTERLQRISTKLIQEENIESLYEQILEAATVIMRSDMGSMQMYLPGKKALHLLAWKGLPSESAKYWEWVTIPSDTLCSAALDFEERLIIPDMSAWEIKRDPEVMAHYRLSGIKAMQSTPLISRRGRLVGMISTHWRKLHQPLERELKMLDLLVRQAADLIERKQAEEALVASEERFRQIFELSPDAIFVQTNKKIAFINPAGMRMFGANKVDELIGKQVLDLVHPDCREAVENRMHHSSEKSYELPRFEEKLLRLDGSDLDAESVAVPIDYQGEPGALVMIRDISERKRVEEALRESEVRFRTMADGTPMIIWVTDASGRIEFVNKEYCDYFGVTLEQVKSEGWQPLVHPETKGYVDIFIDSMRHQHPFHAQTRTLRYDGEWRWITSRAQPRFSESGEFLGMAGSSLDITDQKRAEENLQRYARELEHSNQALRDFTFFASHDLQEPLRKVKTFGNILNKRYKKELGEDGKDYIERMVSAVERMSTMLKGLLVYSRISSHGEPFVDVDLRQVVTEVLADLEVRIQQTRGNIQIGELPNLKGDPIQVRLLFQNLIANGLKFHQPDLAPVVTITARSNGEKMVEITVQDNGIGFDMAQADCIFEPFRRLQGKLEYEGSGMGLAICKKIIERHGGKIAVSSVPGQGSTFTVYLPAIDQK